MESILCATLLLLCGVFSCKGQEMANPHRGERFKEGTFVRVEGMAATHILKTTQVRDSFECLAECLSHTTCQSFNFQINGSPKHLCELSDSPIMSSPYCQTPKPGFSYFYPFQSKPPSDACSEDKDCKNGGTCTNVCGIRICKCQAFNKGENCEEWTSEISSCKDVFIKTSYRANMAYTFAIDSKVTHIYCHLTNDICEGGGWTLTMKIDDSATFQYSAAIWNNKQSHNLTAGQTGFDNFQTKMPSYWAMPFDKLCVGFKVSNVLKWIVIPYKASSLYDVIADGQYRQTSITKATWMSLIGGASLQPNCNQQGFNTYGYTRIGIRSNQENDCYTCDSALGLGINRHYSCGNYCGSTHCSNSAKQVVAFGYLLIQ